MSDIIHDLGNLKEIHASERLHERIQTMAGDLPISERLPVFPLFYAARIVLAVLLLFVFLGSGMVLAAYNSNSNSPLFPIKKAIVKAQLNFVKNPVAREQLQKEIAEPTPTPMSPTPTEKPEPTKEIEGKPSIVVPNGEERNNVSHESPEGVIKTDEKTSAPSVVLGAKTHKDGNDQNKVIVSITPEPTLSLIPQNHED